MNKITAREILNRSHNEIFYNFNNSNYLIVYDNNEEDETKLKELILNRYLWDMFLLFPNTPIIKEMSVKTITRDSYYNSSVHVKLLEKIFKYICEYNNLYTYEQKEPLARLVLQIVNFIQNDLLHKIMNYIPTVDATDFINIIDKPEIKKVHENLKPTQDGVEYAYKEIKRILTQSKDIDNRFIHAYKSKAVDENQSNQCIGPRGFISDLDRSVYKQPVLSGFIKGLDTLFEIIAESRTAAKSLNANDNHIKTSEYTSRRLQLLSMPVISVEPTDCGSTEYFEILINEDSLPNLKGKYYLDEDNTLKYLTGNEKHLYNKIVKLRTVLGCKLEQNNKVCSVCLGEISNNFRKNSNLGYTFVSYLMEKSTQSILSTKHLTHSVKKTIPQLEGSALKYFYIDENNYIYFNKDIDLKDIKIVLYSSQVNKLTDALTISSKNISLSKIGEITDIAILNYKSKHIVTDVVDLSYKERNCIITNDFFNFIKNSTIETDSRGNFIIPLDNYDKSQPVFYNPLKEKDIITFVHKLARIIESNLDKVTNPYEKLDLLFNHVVKQFNCNLSILEVIIYATTAYNAYNLNYKLGRNSPRMLTYKESNIFANRNLAALLVFENQIKAFFNNGFNLFENSSIRQSHPFDILFTPNEILSRQK